MTAITSASSGSSATTGLFSSGEKIKIDFFKLLVAKLRHQNVMSEQSDEDFLTQLAQFESLDQITGLGKTMQQMLEFQQLQQSSSLLGKEVELADEFGNPIAAGEVDRVVFQEGKPWVVVDGTAYGVDSIVSIK